MEEEIYPIIWKQESCLRGECKGDRSQHWWSLPFTAAMGLMCECYHCHKFKHIIVEK